MRRHEVVQKKPLALTLVVTALISKALIHSGTLISGLVSQFYQKFPRENGHSVSTTFVNFTCY